MQAHFILASLSGIIILNSFFFGAILLVNSGGLVKNRLLAFLLFGIAMRTGKSIIMLLFPEIPDSIPAIGLIGMGAIGPFLYFYCRHLLDDRLQWRNTNFLHLIFSVATGVVLPFASNNVVFWLYFLTAVQMAVYIGLSIRLRIKANATHESLKWLTFLLIAVTIIWGVYAMQLYFHQLTAYLTGTVAASLVLFALLFFALRPNKIFSRTRSIIRSDKHEALSKQIMALMENEKLYKDSDLTLAKLGMLLKEKPYVISMVLNTYHGKSFPEFVNYYRINEAQQLLKSEKHNAYSIEAIAFDCGFNTPSAFYTHFKKLTKVTPSEFKGGLR